MRRLTEKLQAPNADHTHSAQLPGAEQLAELLANPPSPPDPANLASANVGVCLWAEAHELGVLTWASQVRQLRERIAAAARAGETPTQGSAAAT